MEETRVTKFKKYRQSFSQENAPVFETSKSNKKKEPSDKTFSTTSTLPIDEVISTLEEDKKQVAFLKKRQRRKILMIILIALGVSIVVAGLIVWAVLIFR